MTKVFGDVNPVVTQISTLTEGIGYPLVPVEDTGMTVTVSAPRLIFDAEDLTNQTPTGLDVVTQMTFGTAVTAPEASVDAAGNITTLIAGTFNVVLDFALARIGNPQSTVTVFRFTVNGTQVSTPIALQLDDSSTNLHFQFEANLQAQAGDVYRMEFYRDSIGINDGFLQSVATTLFGQSASAGLRMSLYEATS